ncbi:hypothetical protein [Herbaspirillum huttiense]|uniref:hypothetical protein n=1 Tax=Herbaspirillum huttiense TaxID=863372 RepID=UPI003B3BDCD2
MRSPAIVTCSIATLALLASSCGSDFSRYTEPNDYAYEPEEALCADENDRISELEEQLERARSQLATLEDRKNQLQAAAEDLQSNVHRLAFENWKDVIPDIDASADYVEDEAMQMESEISEAQSVLEDR